MWGRRDRFPKDATFVAAIGETAYRLNRLDLARDYLKAAVDLSPNKVDWCTRVRSACLQKKVRCPTVPPHRPPLVLSGAYEHICWGNILLSYGLNEAAVAYLEQAVSIEPAWGNTQAGKDIERLRRSAADERR